MQRMWVMPQGWGVVCHSDDLWTLRPRSTLWGLIEAKRVLKATWGVCVRAECCSVSGNSSFFLPIKEKKALNCHSGDIFSLIFRAGWFQVVIRADFWMCSRVVFRLRYRTWQTISAATQYEIWILVSCTSRDQRDNQDYYVMMSWQRTWWHEISSHTHRRCDFSLIITLTSSPRRVLHLLL